MNLRPFQIAMLGVFLFLAIGGVVLLTVFDPASTEEIARFGDKVEIWGTLDAEAMRDTQREIEAAVEGFGVVSYRQFQPWQFEDEFVNAVAEGRTPDLILLPSEELVTFRSKLQPISYETIPVRDFRDTYIDAAEIFAMQNGVYALPLGVDPVVMLWNRDLFAEAGLSTPPTTWEEIVSRTVPSLTILNSQRSIVQSAIAFGDYRNITFGKEMLLTLALQSGSAMTTETGRGYQLSLNQSFDGSSGDPFESAAQFFTIFSNPNNALYSWNRSFGSDQQTFLAGDLALYFTPGSYVPAIEEQNPNLNFDVALIPQGEGATQRRVYGSVYGFAIPAATRNRGGAYLAAQYFTSAQYASVLTERLAIAPVRRDLLNRGSSDPTRSVVMKAGLISRGWLDPDQVQSDGILRQVIEDITSNRARVNSAVSDALSRIGRLY